MNSLLITKLNRRIEQFIERVTGWRGRCRKLVASSGLGLIKSTLQLSRNNERLRSHRARVNSVQPRNFWSFSCMWLQVMVNNSGNEIAVHSLPNFDANLCICKSISCYSCGIEPLLNFSSGLRYLSISILFAIVYSIIFLSLERWTFFSF